MKIAGLFVLLIVLVFVVLPLLLGPVCARVRQRRIQPKPDGGHIMPPAVANPVLLAVHVAHATYGWRRLL